MFCQNCGHSNADDYRYCIFCGNPLMAFDVKTEDGRYVIGRAEPQVGNQRGISMSVQVKSGSKTTKDVLEATPDEEPRILDSQDRRIIVPLCDVPDQVIDGGGKTAVGGVPKWVRVLIACAVVLALYVFLTVVVIPGLNLQKQGAIIQVVVMGVALAAIRAAWKSIVGGDGEDETKGE